MVGILGTPKRKPFDDGYRAARRLDEHGGGSLGTPEDALEKIAHLPFDDGYRAARRLDEHGGGSLGTPEDALEKIAHLQELSGGFGTWLCFVHNWIPLALARKSYELLAGHVMPPIRGLLRRLDLG